MKQNKKLIKLVFALISILVIFRLLFLFLMPKRKRQLREVTNIEEFEFRNDSLTLEDVQILTKQVWMVKF